MPNQTFFNLPDEKRKVLIAAAKKEFSRVPLYEASIANIIKEADIARGSFYQYFEDKEDLYFYLLQVDADARRQDFILNIQKNDGDLFLALTEIFKSMLEEIDNDEAKKFYRHVFLNMNYKTEKTFMNNKMDAEINQYIVEIKSLVDSSDLNITNDEEFNHLIQISTTVMMQNIVRKFAANLSNEEVLNSYNLQLKLLKRGFIKK